jgi:hypothetical protein
MALTSISVTGVRKILKHDTHFYFLPFQMGFCSFKSSKLLIFMGRKSNIRDFSSNEKLTEVMIILHVGCLILGT